LDRRPCLSIRSQSLLKLAHLWTKKERLRGKYLLNASHNLLEFKLQVQHYRPSKNRARRKVYHTIAAVRNSANQAKIGDPSTVEFDKIREMVKAGEVGAGPPAALPVG